MDSIGYAQLHKLIARSIEAERVAWKYYDELNSRPTAHILYVANGMGLGVMAAGFAIPAKDRKLRTRTHRRQYLQYELDENFNLLRVRHMNDYNRIDCTYHVFHMDGILYAHPFAGNRKEFYPQSTIAIEYSEGKPICYTETRPHCLCADFYTYPDDTHVRTTRYLYFPCSVYTSTGHLASWTSPMNAQDSPVTLDYREEEYTPADFKKYF